MVKIIITGPESTGKTTLCKALSRHLKISFSKEYAREYLKDLRLNYCQEDLIKIAKKQLKSEENMQLLDTDLITIKIWSEYKYGSCNKWILEELEKQKFENRFYLLCSPDIEWVADHLREGSSDRIELFKIYRQEIEKLGHRYYIIKGKNRDINAVSKILDKRFLL